LKRHCGVDGAVDNRRSHHKVPKKIENGRNPEFPQFICLISRLRFKKAFPFVERLHDYQRTRQTAFHSTEWISVIAERRFLNILK